MINYPRRGEVYWVSLDPVIGSETKKTRPCLIISNNAQNKKGLRVIIAPITSKVKTVYPFEAKVTVKGKEGKALLDQIRAVDKRRLGQRIDGIGVATQVEIDKALRIALAL